MKLIGTVLTKELCSHIFPLHIESLRKYVGDA